MLANPRGGLAFDDDDVARAYIHRPPYPAEVFAFLADLPVQRRRGLDLGCGPGKIAHQLADHFDHIDAVDPSQAMLAAADNGLYPHISWIHGYAETAQLAPQYDLVTAGASIHWMDHSLLFPRLASVLAPGGFIAIIEGDDAHDVPWQAEWEAFLARWLVRIGSEYDPDGYREKMSAHRAWMEIVGERTFESNFSQSVEDFIECQHSRATWSRANLGPELAPQFGDDLSDILKPYSNDGVISYKTIASVSWGKPRDGER